MARISCLAGIDSGMLATFDAVLRSADVPTPAVRARLAITDVSKLRPALLVCDLDGLAVDALELLRQLRFVLPACIIAVYSGATRSGWSLDCHLAGANGLLAKQSTRAELVTGVRDTWRSGCFTDPRFAAV